MTHRVGWIRVLLLTGCVIAPVGGASSLAQSPSGTARAGAASPPAAVPLFRDPIHDGAADPVVVWNRARKTWWMFYTNRRADLDDNSGVTWVHGTRIGIAESADGGAHLDYVGEADIPVAASDYTLWAPEVIDVGGTYHMFLTVVPGTFTDWNHPRHIQHLTSTRPPPLEAARRRQPRIRPHHRRMHLPPAQRPLASLVQERGRQLQGLLQRFARPGSLDTQGHRDYESRRRPGRLPVARIVLAHQRSARRPRRLSFQRPDNLAATA